MSQRKIPYLFLLLIFLLSLFLRLFHLSSIPPGLNRDEASIGYTAYSLLQTGKDEYGVSWPVSFKSFGDWKLPLYIYLTLPFIAVFDLTEFAVRFPSAFLGSITVVISYFLAKELFGNYAKDKKEAIALLTALFLAISPWHLFMSRNASESNVAVFLVVFSLLLLLRSFKKPFLLILSYLLLSLSLFTYHGNHIFTPLLFIATLVFYRKRLIQNRWLLPSVGIFLILTSFIYTKTLFGADKTKISGLFPLGDKFQVHKEIELQRRPYSSNVIGKLLHNKGVFLVSVVVHNYLRGFSPEFLFVTGGTNTQHTIPGFGNLYTWQAFVLPIAIYFLVRKKEKHGTFLLFWLLISPIAASITRDAPHTNRMMGILPLPAILTAYGLVSIITRFRGKRVLFLGILLGGLVIFGNFIVYLDKYFVQFPRLAANEWGSGYKNLVLTVSRLQSEYEEIIISRPYVSPYIYFIFYQRVNPEMFYNEVVRYPETSEGFQHVKQFNNLVFREIDWGNDILIPGKLYIDWIENVPQEATASTKIVRKKDYLRLSDEGRDIRNVYLGMKVASQLIDTVYLSNGKPQFYLIETKAKK